jgi:hypothetical protein
MKLELPTGKQFIRFSKYSLFAALPFLVLGWWLVKTDPVLEEVEGYLVNNAEITGKVGSVTNLKLLKATYVNGAVNYDGIATPGYSLYRFKITGTSGKTSATVKVEKSEVAEMVVKEVRVYE